MAAQIAGERLDIGVRGQVIEPGDEGYDVARQVYNGMIDKRPRAIVQCADVADVMATVNFARDHDILLAVRGRGHNGAGLGVCDDGIVLDLSRLSGIRVDPATQTVRAGGGCSQGDVDHASHAFGLHVPAGVVSSTGIGGLTLGGGHGYLSRRWGLTIDNLLEADVVLADGTLVTANAEQHADLFWAIRGGGGNFGIATSFLYRAHPVDTVVAGPMLWPMEHATEVIQWYREFLPAAPETFYGVLTLDTAPPLGAVPEALRGRPMCGIVWCYTGPEDQAEAVFEPVRRFRPPEFEHVGPMPFTTLQSMVDPLFPPGLQWYWKGDFVNEISDEAIAEHLRHVAQRPTPQSIAHFYPIDGAVQRVAPGDTAWGYRDATWSLVIAGIDADPANAEAVSTWAKDYWTAVHPYSAGGAYINFMMEEGVDRIQATYRGNYDRLVDVKTQYDPHNLFKVNQNILPRT